MAARGNSTTLGIERSPVDARSRILEAAYDLFSRHGIRAVGVDTVIEQADVAKMTCVADGRPGSQDDPALLE